MPNKDTVVALISDMQVGGTTALCPPSWNLLDGGTFRASPAQRIIYRQWLKSAEKVKDLLYEKRGRKRLVVILNGEPIDNHHHDTPQVISKRPQEQIDMAIALLDEWLGVVNYTPDRWGDCMYLVRGTSAHEKGEHIEQIGRDIDGVVPMRKDTSVLQKDGRYHFNKLLLRINGELFDIAHHGFTTGTRWWTKGNAIRYALKSIYLDCLDDKLEIPRWVIRSHFHEFLYGNYPGKQQEMWGCITPGWQLLTHYGHRVASNRRLSDIGMVYFDIPAQGGGRWFKEIIEVENTPVMEL